MKKSFPVRRSLGVGGSFLILVFFLVLSARGEPPALSPPNGLSRDLGQGLTYHRVRALPADLPTAESARRQPCVLDLRYVHATAGDAAALEAWVKFRASARTPIIILANTDTDPALLAPFSARHPTAGVIIIGASAPGFAPDIALKFSREDERRAYDALESGADLASLLNDSPGKPRNDEARLARDHAPDSAPTDEESTAGKPAKPGPRPPVIDAALQRAIQLHRALVALKKL